MLSTLRRRRFAPLMLLACAALVGAAPAQAQSYPSKAVRVINNFPPGGPSDILARSFGQVLQETLKQPFVVDNRAGAAGNIGADVVARSAPDGYTLLMTIDTALTINPHIYGKSMPFKPSDLKPVMILASSGLMVAVNPATGIQSMKDLITTGKGKGLTFSSGGNGSPGHLAAEILQETTGVKISHVPYKGNSPAVTAVLSGEVEGGILATPGIIPQIKVGRVRGLAVTSAKRSPLAPDVPTVAELGYPDLQYEVLYLLMAPAATPDSVIKLLQDRLMEGYKRADIQDRMKSLDLHPEGTINDAATQKLSDNFQRYGRIVRMTGMSLD